MQAHIKKKNEWKYLVLPKCVDVQYGHQNTNIFS